MALAKNFTKTVVYVNELDNGERKQEAKEYKNAYIKVCAVGGSKEMVDAVVHIYEARGDEKPLSIFRYSFVPSTEEHSCNFIRQAYEHLKRLPEYQDAKDC